MLKVIEAARRSAENGKRIELDSAAAFPRLTARKCRSVADVSMTLRLSEGG